MNSVLLFVVAEARVTCYANDNDAFVPELWAKEGVALLTENMVAANLVNVDFKNELAQFGDIVHTRKVSKPKVRRKTGTDDYESKDVTATNIPVPLNQLFYDSFVLRDHEMSLSMKDLVDAHLLEHIKGLARGIDRSLLGFMVKSTIKTPTARSGRLGAIGSTTAKDYLLSADEILNKQLCYEDGRNLCMTPTTKTGILSASEFTKVNERGGRTALEKAQVGQLFNFTSYMGQNVPSLTTEAVDSVSGTVTNALAAGGSGSQTVSIVGYEAQVGEFFTVAGNDQPTYATAATVSTDTTALTANEANKFATLASAVVRLYKSCDVDGAYAAGYQKEITLDGHTANKGPQVGQILAFGTSTRHTYVIVETEVVSSTSTKVILDRPLDYGLSNNDLAFPGPAGSYNPAFHKNAFAFVSRPMWTPPSNVGVSSAVANWNGLSLRVTLQYDSTKGGLRVNLDVLAGFALLDADLATLILG